MDEKTVDKNAFHVNIVKGNDIFGIFSRQNECSFTFNVLNPPDSQMEASCVEWKISNLPDLTNETSRIVEKFNTEHLTDGWDNISINDVGLYEGYKVHASCIQAFASIKSLNSMVL